MEPEEDLDLDESEEEPELTPEEMIDRYLNQEPPWCR